MRKTIALLIMLVVLASCNPSNLDTTKTPTSISTKMSVSTLLPTTTTPKIVATPTLPPYSGINKISVSPDGSNLIVADTNGVWIYNLPDGELIQFQEGNPIIYIHAFYIAQILWSPDGNNVAVSQDKNGIWIWDTKTWELLTEINGESWQEVRENPGFSWAPNGEKLALGTGNGNVSIWDKKTNKWEVLEKKIKTEGTQLGVLWTKDNRITTVLASKMFDVETGEYIKDVPTWIDGPGLITWSPNQTHIYFFFDMGGGLVDLSKDYLLLCCNNFSWSNNSNYFATFSSYGKAIYVIDTSSNKIIYELPQDKSVYALAWTPTDELLAASFVNEKLVLQNAVSGEIVMDLSKHVVK